MSDRLFSAALANFAAAAAVLNAKTLMRAGLMAAGDVAALHQLVANLEEIERTSEEQELLEQLKAILE